MPPKRRFWNEPLDESLRSTFQGCQRRMWVENPHFIFCSPFQNLRLGLQIGRRKDTLCPPQTKIFKVYLGDALYRKLRRPREIHLTGLHV